MLEIIMRKMSTYEEKKALLVLHNLLNFNLEDWETADRPDLQNKTASWGIEVVRDLYPKEIESEKHIKSVWNLPYSKWPKKKLKILSKNKVKLNIANDALQSASLGETVTVYDLNNNNQTTAVLFSKDLILDKLDK